MAVCALAFPGDGGGRALDSIVLNISNIILLKLFLNGGSALVYMIMIHWFMATVKILLEIKHLFH